MQEREVISKEELLRKLNEELSRHSEYYLCKYEDVTKLDAADETGANWKDALLVCSGMHAGTCKPTAFELVNEMRKKYNIS